MREKKDLRRQALAARRALDPARRDSDSAAIARRALELPELAGATSVLAYAAMPDEVDPAPLVSALRSRGVRVALPRVCGPGELALHWTPDGTELVAGSFGIAEPPLSCLSAAPEDLDVVLVPGLAFDASCVRLGFGGGYYDALLAPLSARVRTVALAFDEQVVSSVPAESHDVVVDVVVTPTRTYRRPEGPGPQRD